MVITFLPRSKHPLISWLRSPSAMIFGAKIKSVTVSPSICHEVIELDAIILVFWMLSFKPAFWVKTQLYLWGEQLKWLDISLETVEARRKWHSIFKVLTEKKQQCITQQKYPSGIKGKSRPFSDKGKPGAFVASRKDWLREVL